MLIAANPANPFVALLYSFTGIFLLPFAGIGSAAGGQVLEVATTIAMVAYAVLGWMLDRVAWVIFYRPYVTVPAAATTIIDQPIRFIGEIRR